MEENVYKGHTLNYAGGTITLTGVKDVKSFEEREVSLILENNGMVIKGRELTVSELNLKSGFVKISGTAESIAYNGGGTKEPMLKRLFK
ncbi:MAG: YabP/YqfC family sporulation protein [Clostridia bacterium]